MCLSHSFSCPSVPPPFQIIVNEFLLAFLPELVEYYYYPTVGIRYRSPQVLQGFQMTITPVASALVIDEEVGMAKDAVLTYNEQNGKMAGIHLEGKLENGDGGDLGWVRICPTADQATNLSSLSR